MSPRKFHKTVFTVTVISEEPVNELNLEELAGEILYGDASGAFEISSNEVIDAAQAAKELIAQESSPAFLNLDDEGNDG